MEAEENKSSTANRDIIYAVRKLAGTDRLGSSLMIANITAVNESDRTCDVEIVLGDNAQKITGVLLSSDANDGFILIPEIDTNIVICLMADNSAYMLLCNDISKVICVVDSNNKYEFDATGFIWNGGTKGGLINILDITNELNSRYTILKAAMLAGFTASDAGVTSAGGTPTAVSAYNGAIASFTNLNKTAYEDTTIKH